MTRQKRNGKKLTDEERRQILSDFESGVSVAKLAKCYRRAFRTVEDMVRVKPFESAQTTDRDEKGSWLVTDVGGGHQFFITRKGAIEHMARMIKRGMLGSLWQPADWTIA